MATLQQIRERVSRKLQDPDNTDRSVAVINDEINRSIDYYQNYRFWFNEDQANITLNVDDNVVPNIPSDLISELQVNGLLLIDSQVKIDLIKLLPNDFFERDQDQTGRPYFYTYRNGEFLVFPTPQQAYPVRFRYLKSYTDLVNDSDTNDFTDNAPDLIMLHTLKNLYAEDKQDSQYASYYAELERSELMALRERTDNLNGTGRIKGHSILETTYYY